MSGACRAARGRCRDGPADGGRGAADERGPARSGSRERGRGGPASGGGGARCQCARIGS